MATAMTSSAASYTSITNGVEWQASNVVNEFTITYNEHATAIGSNGIATILAGDDIQGTNFWKPIQQFLSRNCTSFLDWAAVDTGGTNADLPNMTFTWTGLQARAGVDFMRRATQWDPDGGDVWTNYNDSMYWAVNGGGTGTIEAGDIIGPWVFEDLQKMYSELDVTFQERGLGQSSPYDVFATNTSFKDTLVTVTGFVLGQDNEASGRVAQVSAWDNTAWTTNIFGASLRPYEVKGRVERTAPFSFTVEGDRERGQAWAGQIATHIPSEASIWFLSDPASLTINAYSNRPTGYDGYPWTIPTNWYRVETLAVTNTPQRFGSVEYGRTNNPVPQFPIASNETKRIEINETVWTYDWEFSFDNTTP